MSSVGFSAGLNRKFTLQPTLEAIRHDRNIAIPMVVFEHLISVLDQHVLRAIAIKDYPARAREYLVRFLSNSLIGIDRAPGRRFSL